MDASKSCHGCHDADAVIEKANNYKSIVRSIADDWENVLRHLEYFNRLQSIWERPLTIAQCIHFIVNTDIMNKEITTRPIKKRRIQERETIKSEPMDDSFINQTNDAETIDAETIDAETIDAETIDAETIDAETIDAETIDAETTSTETIDTETTSTETTSTETIDAENYDIECKWKKYNISLDDMLQHLHNHYTVFKTLPTNNPILMDFYHWCQKTLLMKVTKLQDTNGASNYTPEEKIKKIMRISNTLKELINIEKESRLNNE